MPGRGVVGRMQSAVPPASRAGGRTDGFQDDAGLVASLAGRDEAAFASLVDAWTPGMLRLALVHVPSRAVAEEVVQEAWLTALRDLDRFQGRSALRTWVYGIAINVARARGRAERRSTPFSSVGGEDRGPVLDPTRFEPEDDPQWAGHWAIGPTPWPTPEDALLAGETLRVILASVAELPAAQRDVITLRDLEGCTAEETRNVLGIRDTNQRGLLHRARTRVRLALEEHFEATEPT